MESMRDIDRTMGQEITKGSCPLKSVRVEFNNSSYQETVSREKLLGVLSYLLRVGDYGRSAEKGMGNNVHMGMKGREAAFKHTRSFIDRNNIFSTIHRYGKRIEPDFDGHTYLETARCCFELPEGEQEKYQVTYNGQGTFVSPMSDKYTPGLYTHCISARRAAPEDMDIPSTDFSGKKRDIVSLEEVRDVLFQYLLFDTIKCGEDVLYADLRTIYCLKQNR